MHSMRMSSSTELRSSGESGCTVTVRGCSIRSNSTAAGESQLTAVGPAARRQAQDHDLAAANAAERAPACSMVEQMTTYGLGAGLVMTNEF